jgi:hypothetical protein
MARKGLTPRLLSLFTKGAASKKKISVDEILGWLLNISFALLIVFILASLLYSEDMEKLYNQAMNELGVLHGKYRKISETPRGEMFENFEKALMDVQREKLLLGLEQVMSNIRRDFGLSNFGRENEKGEQIYLLSDILFEGKVVNERFKNGCVLAKQAFSDQKQMEREIFSKVCLLNGMVLNDSSTDPSIADHPEVITKENNVWFLEQVSSKVKATYTDCCTMQKDALAYLMDFYQEHLDLLINADLRKQLEQVLDEKLDEEKMRRISEFSQRLYQHVKDLFDQQNVPLLVDV